jgi:hypothetical protein
MNIKLTSITDEEGIDHSIVKPQEKDYDNWDEYWSGLCKYLKDKYRKTYIPIVKEKE